MKGIGTFYREYGNPKDEHVLFIHGLGASSLAWRDIPDAMSEYFHTITVDLIGFGGSEKPEYADYTIKGFSKFIIDFLIEIIKIEEKEHTTISIVGHSLGGYIAAQVAIQNKKMINKLVLIDPSGLLEGPTPLLKDFRVAATEVNPVARYEKVKRVLEDLYAGPSRLLPVAVDLFNYTIEKPGAKHAFEAAFDNSTTTQIEPEGFKQIEDIPCFIIWGEKDNLIPIEYYHRFREELPTAKFETIVDAGHAPFVEKTALIYEKLRTFLMQDDATKRRER
ncbi:MAG TPA: alpha/beta hydrolase [Candidatus Nitrosopolaris sp.]|nr:alpha/beta hydrolase [Candidatus Nitrosopolaris sp.]